MIEKVSKKWKKKSEAKLILKTYDYMITLHSLSLAYFFLK